MKFPMVMGSESPDKNKWDKKFMNREMMIYLEYTIIIGIICIKF